MLRREQVRAHSIEEYLADRRVADAIGATLRSEPEGSENRHSPGGKMRRQVHVPVSVGALVRMSPAQRDEVFRSSPAGDVPCGKGDGVALLPLGSLPTRVAAAVIRALVWKGKVFDPRYDGLRNRMTPFGFRLIRAKVYKDPSWVDGEECIVLDYARTSLVAHWIRDEIREVAGRTYLGQVFVRGRKLLHFTLTFPPST